MDLFARRRQRLLNLKVLREQKSPAALQVRKLPCPGCGRENHPAQLAESLYVCPCGYHNPVGAYYRLSTLLDEHTFKELNAEIPQRDWLDFPGYAEKRRHTRGRTGLDEAVVTATGRLDGTKAVFAVMDSHFMMGSMSAAVGEKITLAIEYANAHRLPLILFCASGGARMQEGIFSLMQMAKTSAAMERFSRRGGLSVVCLTHPTTGGVTASFAMLGDYTLAEPEALIGFAGPRVIEQTIGEKLPQGFQRSEYLQQHGFVDAVVPRAQLRETIARLLRLHRKGG